MGDAFVFECFAVEPVDQVVGGGEALQLPEGGGEIGAGPGIVIALAREACEGIDEDRLGSLGLEVGGGDGVPGRAAGGRRVRRRLASLQRKQRGGVLEGPEVDRIEVIAGHLEVGIGAGALPWRAWRSASGPSVLPAARQDGSSKRR